MTRGEWAYPPHGRFSPPISPPQLRPTIPLTYTQSYLSPERSRNEKPKYTPQHLNFFFTLENPQGGLSRPDGKLVGDFQPEETI